MAIQCRAVAERMPDRAMVPTMRLLWIDGVLHQAFDETSGKPGLWVPVGSIMVDKADPPKIAGRAHPAAATV